MQPSSSGFTFVDVSGVGNSGKSAVTDILREFEAVWVPHNQFEFDLIRVPGGILDLHHHLVEDWSPVRSHHAINEFRHLVTTMGIDPSWLDVKGLMESSSQRYDRAFKGAFRELGQSFADGFTLGEYVSTWPYDSLFENPFVRFTKKVIRRTLSPRHGFSKVQLTTGKDFTVKTTLFLNQLYSKLVESGQRHVVLNNAFEAYNPERSIGIIDGACSILVTRDPRDVYVSGQSAQKLTGADRELQADENDGFNKTFLASDDLDLFILRYQTLMENVYSGNHPRVLKLCFEDLVHSYEESLRKVRVVASLEAATHSSPKRFFDPAKSARNVGLWNRYSKQSEIRHIEQRLGAYLWQG